LDKILFMLKISLQILILLFTFPGIAQQPLTIAGENSEEYSKTVLDSQRDYLYKFYYQKVGGTDELINGRDYIPYYSRAKFKPLLLDEKKRTASIILNGRKYNGLTLEYDMFLDEVIYSDSNKVINDGLFKIALNKDPVDGFSLYFGQDSMIFSHFKSDDEKKSGLPEGFYEIVYSGASKFVIKHQSFVLVMDGIEEYIYTPADYVMVGDFFSKIKSSKGFIKLFGEKSEEIKRFIRTNRVNIRKADKKQIASVLKYYDNLVVSEK
jgi:hypothetical protein